MPENSSGRPIRTRCANYNARVSQHAEGLGPRVHLHITALEGGPFSFDDLLTVEQASQLGAALCAAALRAEGEDAFVPSSRALRVVSARVDSEAVGRLEEIGREADAFDRALGEERR